MATRFLYKALLLKPTAATTTVTSPLCRSVLSTRSVSLLRTALRPLSSAAHFSLASISARCFSTRTTTSSLNDPSPNWSNRPPKETILLDGCDFEHWLVVMEKPEGDPTRDEIIDSYIKTLAMVVGSEEEARKKIYSVSTRCYFAFGALVSEELSYKIKELPKVRWVLPDSYLDVKNKDYGGEPFIDGKAVPYDPKYHEEWIRNNAKANERNRRNDRPRNFDRSRNFERRRENMQNRDFQNREPPMSNQGMQHSAATVGGMPQNSMGGPGGPPPPPPGSYPGGMTHNNMPNHGMQHPPPNMGGMPQNNMGGPGGPPSPPPGNYPPPPPPGNYRPPPPPGSYPPPPPPSNYPGGMTHNNMGGPAGPQQPPNSYMGGMPNNNFGGMPPNNVGGMPPPNNMGGVPPNAGWSNNTAGNYQGMPYQGPPSYQGSYNPGRDGNGTGGNQ
ncbi:hypothetical protein K2173_006702 [Erythroxylum novogranatense]|uniref:MORF/ORRM1/DAG-like MORF domain-containing protein n=1 Tax=Erythroxylum novogranatense TaxID=1862640 RepID=A0AAV8TCY5_9ROSI|nr:hypothetical protein K2173_006702 [Erythroxylum novogranatense]